MFLQKVLLGVCCSVALFTLIPIATAESELLPDQVTMMRGRVIDITSEVTREIPGTDTLTQFQTIEAEILTGDEAGKRVTIENDYLNLEVGESFYMTHTIDKQSDIDVYHVNDPYRLPQLSLLVGLFVVLVIVFGGKQGIRGLISLVGSFACIFFLLLPGILEGYPPLLVTISIASLIIVLGSYITHGFNRTTTAAVIGMIATVLFTGLLAYFAVAFTRLSGFGAEEAIYLNINSRGSIDIIGLLLGGILIGLLGVLYDAAIGQAVSVDELTRIAPHVSRRKIFERTIRIGREHIGALVNTLAIAYVGAALPLLLLFYQTASADIEHIINTEIFATEIVRIMIGSIGLVLAVPITTLVSVFLLVKKPTGDIDPNILEEEAHTLEHASHHHSH